MHKIALVANTDWYLYNFRRSLASLLIQRDYQVLLISPAGDYSARLQADGFRWTEWKVGRQSVAPWLETSAIYALARIYRHEHPDLAHHHTIKPVLYGSLAARLAGNQGSNPADSQSFSRRGGVKPAVVNSITGRGYVLLSEDAKASILKQITRPLYRLALDYPNQAVIFENEGDRYYFLTQNLVSPGRSWLIPGVGVDADHFVPPSPGVEALAGSLVILMAGRMLWDKGVGVLVEAARILRQRDARTRVLLVGAPDPGNPASIPEEQLRAWAAEGIVEWLGWQTDMLTIYQQAHIVTLPSFFEGVPTVLLEAAACGRPIVATDIPGCREIVQNEVNGYLVPPNNAIALVEALEKLLNDPTLRGRMGAASRQITLEKFTIQHINQATLAVYQNLMSHPERKEGPHE